MNSSVLRETAPAKINLTLEVLGKRDDGYHEVRTVLQTVSLADTLYFQPAQDTIIRCGNIPEWSAEVSLVGRAVELIRETADRQDGFTLNIEKRIPLTSGLGGDSSDAAATLRGLNRLWGLGYSAEKLRNLAARLGSDVPFFIEGGTALAAGRGERLTILPRLAGFHVVLAVPDINRPPGKTAGMYAALKPVWFTDGSITVKLVDSIKRDERKAIPSLLFNIFENIAFEDFTVKRVYVDHLLKLEAPRARLAGSGPTLFALFEDEGPAREFYQRCRDQGMDVHLAETI